MVLRGLEVRLTSIRSPEKRFQSKADWALAWRTIGGAANRPAPAESAVRRVIPRVMSFPPQMRRVGARLDWARMFGPKRESAQVGTRWPRAAARPARPGR